MTSSHWDSNIESIDAFASFITTRDFRSRSITTTIGSRICKISWTSKSKDCNTSSNSKKGSRLIPKGPWPYSIWIQWQKVHQFGKYWHQTYRILATNCETNQHELQEDSNPHHVKSFSMKKEGSKRSEDLVKKSRRSQTHTSRKRVPSFPHNWTSQCVEYNKVSTSWIFPNRDHADSTLSAVVLLQLGDAQKISKWK